MQLDIRIPIGLLFGIIGVILIGFGVAGPPDIYVRSLDVNVNLWWGAALVVFAIAMLALAWRAAKTPKGP